MKLVIRRPKRRQTLAVLVIVISSMLWINGIRILDERGWPWCITLGAVALGAFLWARSQVQPSPAIALPGEKKPMSFIESLAGTYFLCSIVLLGWMLFHLLHRDNPVPVAPRIVDIELTGLSDYQNRKQLLPSTRDMPTLAKTESPDRKTLKGTLNPVTGVLTENQSQYRAQETPSTESRKPVTKKDQQPKQDHQIETMAPPAEQLVDKAAEVRSQTQTKRAVEVVDFSSLKKSSPMTPYMANTRQANSLSHQQDMNFLEEVKPPEMVELIDNDGDHSRNVWQPGGRSSDGSGANSDLARYLKELNHRIKNAWSPPRGDSRRAELLFRIRRDGQLVSVRIIQSSGDARADKSAVAALTGSAPFKPLPADYPLGYIDIRYSFNYNLDQLTEVNPEPLD